MPQFAVASIGADRSGCDRFHAVNPQYPLSHGFLHDPATINRDELIASGIITADNAYDPWHLAQMLCHIAVWRHCAQADDVMHIVDDQVFLRRDFQTAIAPHVAADDFDLVVWSIDLREPAVLSYAPGVVGRLIHDQSREVPDTAVFANGIAPTRRFRLLHAPNPYGYSISPAGARRLLKACVPFTAELISYFNEPGAMLANMGFDRELARRYAELRAFIVQPLLGVVPEAADRRTITAHFVRSFHHLAGQADLRMHEPRAPAP